MTRCYAEPERWDGDRIALSDEESHHVSRVLRKRPGDTVEVADGQGAEAQAVITSDAGRRLQLQIRTRTQRPAPAPALILFQAILKGDRMDWVLQKAVELGAEALAPIRTDHGVVAIKPERAADKLRRWETIALNAFKQSRAARLPRLAPIRGLDEALDHPPRPDLVLAGGLGPSAAPLHEVLAQVDRSRLGSVGIVIGPEGDFSPDETRRLEARGVRLVSFGERILRAETASLYALSVLSYELQRC